MDRSVSERMPRGVVVITTEGLPKRRPRSRREEMTDHVRRALARTEGCDDPGVVRARATVESFIGDGPEHYLDCLNACSTLHRHANRVGLAVVR